MYFYDVRHIFTRESMVTLGDTNLLPLAKSGIIYVVFMLCPPQLRRKGRRKTWWYRIQLPINEWWSQCCLVHRKKAAWRSRLLPICALIRLVISCKCPVNPVCQREDFHVKFLPPWTYQKIRTSLGFLLVPTRWPCFKSTTSHIIHILKNPFFVQPFAEKPSNVFLNSCRRRLYDRHQVLMVRRQWW